MLDYLGFAGTVFLGVVAVAIAVCLLPDLFGSDDTDEGGEEDRS